MGLARVCPRQAVVEKCSRVTHVKWHVAVRVLQPITLGAIRIISCAESIHDPLGRIVACGKMQCRVGMSVALL